MSTPDDRPAAQPPPPSFASSGAAPDAPVVPVFVQPSRPPVLADPDRPWRWWLGPLAFVVAILPAVAVLYIGALALAGGDSAVVDDNQHWLGLAQDLTWIAVVLLVPFLAVRHLTPRQLGLRAAPLGRSIGILVGVLVAFYLVSALYTVALGLDQDSNTLLEDSGFGDGITRDVVYALVFTVLAPVAEELLFRGLLFRSLRDGFARRGRKTSVALGAVASGLVFGLVHLGGGQNDFIPVLMALGVVLALAYEWSGTLYVPIAIHSINNAIATGANADPSANWIYGLIAAGPVLALGFAFLVGRFVRRVFPQEHPSAFRDLPPAAPSAAPFNL